MVNAFRIAIVSGITALWLASPHLAQRQAPPGMFKDLDDEILGDALVIHGKQLFIDDYVIGELQGVQKTLNQPVKHPQNPVLKRDRPSDGFATDYGTVVFDPKDRRFKMWYQILQGTAKEGASHQYLVGYATSADGIHWEKPITNQQADNNHIVMEPPERFLGGPGVMIDDRDENPQRRFKMMYVANPEAKPSSLSTRIAYSADGIHWKQEPANPVIPFSDTQIAPYWDQRLGRYVAHLRFGPPNTRVVSRIESADFLHWSPKVTVLRKTKLDAPLSTEFYTMTGVPYEGVYIGLLNTYNYETISPIPADKQWWDRVNNQLVFSRNGVTWQRVVKNGVISPSELKDDRDWKREAEQATFLPYGTTDDAWDWGQVYPHHPPLVVGDEIRFYYGGTRNRHWLNYHPEPINSGVGLATLRLDGFVSVNAGVEPGTLTTKPLVFFGDTLEINANAEEGSLTVEALDVEGKVIEGFGAADCTPIITDSVRHVVKWKGNADCHLLQARPIKLQFHLKNAKLYAFEPRIRRNHYLQSYD
ncbi:MAG: hypothetical protein O3C17_17800 [Planctomycetota bacterium]|nr:hypothetical protein [Planctomycetota bacterium]